MKEKKKKKHTLSEKKVGEKEEEGVFLSLFLLSFVRPLSERERERERERGKGTRQKQPSGHRREHNGACEQLKRPGIVPLFIRMADREEGAAQGEQRRKSIERRRRRRKKLHPSSLSRPSTASPAVPLRTHDKASAAPARVGIRARAVLELWAAALWVLSRPHRRSNSLLVPLPPLQKPRPPSFSLLSLSLPSLFRSHAAPFPTSSNLSGQKQGPASYSVLSLAGER